MNTAGQSAPWMGIRCASLPVDDLRVLAGVRGHAEIRVIVMGRRAWVCWDADSARMSELLARRILPVEGVELFTERGGKWYRLGKHLPAFDVPFRDGTEGVALNQIVIPDKLSVLRPGAGVAGPMTIGLVRDETGRVRPATALRCALRVMSAWAEQATSFQLAPLQGAWREAFDGEEDGDGELLVLGAPGTLPLLNGGVTYWGSDLLIPLGFRVEPDLPAAAVRGVAGAGEDDLAIVDENGLELIARAVFEPLMRAGIRLAGAGPREPRPEEGRRA